MNRYRKIEIGNDQVVFSDRDDPRVCSSSCPFLISEKSHGSEGISFRFHCILEGTRERLLPDFNNITRALRWEECLKREAFFNIDTLGREMDSPEWEFRRTHSASFLLHEVRRKIQELEQRICELEILTDRKEKP